MLITTSQLAAVGINHNAIGIRCRRGMLHRLHHGIYLYGPGNLLPGTRELAAVLAGGPSAVVSHLAAAGLWSLVRYADREGVHITAVGRSPRSRAAIHIHRVADLPPDERRLKNGIPVTSPARTLLDFASQASGDELERAIAEAYALRLTTEAELRRVLNRHPHRAGARALRLELDRERGPALTRSEAERLMKLLAREADLPPPLTNRMIAGYRADFVWPEQRLIVEVDGFQFHGHRLAFERDRKRDAAHVLAGYRVIRITWRRLTEERVAVAVMIARALAM